MNDSLNHQRQKEEKARIAKNSTIVGGVQTVNVVADTLAAEIAIETERKRALSAALIRDTEKAIDEKMPRMIEDRLNDQVQKTEIDLPTILNPEPSELLQQPHARTHTRVKPQTDTDTEMQTTSQLPAIAEKRQGTKEQQLKMKKRMDAGGNEVRPRLAQNRPSMTPPPQKTTGAKGSSAAKKMAKAALPLVGSLGAAGGFLYFLA
ncbi:hypothetical protein COY07_01145 [Candidatus Peregrinibacteria bacterium CG_4_10_14_0_2_um_filter_43_11]|nr:MAG: hypothetical protein COY07_01145 [Candidatus Peregrinibacteria bacterium CG_4_10_14_0_2_um_filter_43_11]